MAKKSGAQLGNNNAGKGRDWTDQLRRALKKYGVGDIVPGTALAKIAEKVVEQALEGDKDARQEIANRLDGKPTEYSESYIHQTIEAIAVQATADWVAETISETPIPAPEKPKPH